MAKKNDMGTGASGIPDGRGKQFGSRHSMEQKPPIEKPVTVNGEYPVRQQTPAAELSEKHWIAPHKGAGDTRQP
jgi:hypothetical protein